ncbi:CDP-4-dehydro-6-deoxy-D-gulose 4-reductase [Synergistales bacterium]|nr:CDP-4-dehydro-6-deoxy-D-gulose 4-reductase [Synergistales bacterium]
MEARIKILATGLSGFIGSHIAPLLNERYEVHALTRGAAKKEGDGRVVWHEGDFLDDAFRESILREVKPGKLLHLAWDVTRGYQTSEENYEWLYASFEFFRRFAEQGGRRAVFAGTCFEYDWNNELCVEDVTPIKPQNTYGVCKNALRELVDNYAKDKDISWAWGRIFYPFGAGEQAGRFFPSLIRSALLGERVVVNTGQQSRDFIYAPDVASAFATLLESDADGVFNIGSGAPCKRADAAREICDITGSRKNLEIKALLSDEPDSFYASVQKLKELGWQARYSMREALDEIVSLSRLQFSQNAPRPPACLSL